MISYIKPVRSSSVQLSVTSGPELSRLRMSRSTAGRQKRRWTVARELCAGCSGLKLPHLWTMCATCHFPSVQGSSVPISASGMLCDAISSDLRRTDFSGVVVTGRSNSHLLPCGQAASAQVPVGRLYVPEEQQLAQCCAAMRSTDSITRPASGERWSNYFSLTHSQNFRNSWRARGGDRAL